MTGEGNVVFHCEWDNLNEATTNVHDNNIGNRSGGIVMHEFSPGFESGKARLLSIIDKSQPRYVKVDTPETLTQFHFTRVGPIFSDGSSFSHPAENDSLYAACMQEYHAWLFNRYIGSNDKQRCCTGWRRCQSLAPT